MIAYLDTSAVIPLLIQEPSTQVCRQLWDAADELVATRLMYVEAAAALHAAHRLQRLGAADLHAALAGLVTLWSELSIIELDENLMVQAARYAGERGLRGYDAVHCAAGLMLIDSPDAVLASGDRHLLAAWHVLGAGVCDVTASG